MAKTITVDNRTWERLTLRKIKMKFSTIDEVINDALKECEKGGKQK